MIYLLSIIIFGLQTSFGIQNKIFYISDGHEIQITEAPWQVAILFNDTIHCGGSIIYDKWIISAAHCFHNFRSFPMNHWKIVIGTDNLLEKKLKQYKPKRIIIHGRFDKPFYSNDIALIELEQAINYKDSHAKKIDFADSTNYLSQLCKVHGFGSTKINWWSSRLKEARVSIVNNKLCKTNYCKPTSSNEILPVYKSNICAGNKNGSDACEGDSGGGLVCQNSKQKTVLVGIVSHGEDCGLPDRPTIYTRITSYLDWISFITKKKIGNISIPKRYIYNEKLVEEYFNCPYFVGINKMNH